ncbi:MAG: hypothetical protein WBV73_27545 [Phormidium sp.]
MNSNLRDRIYPIYPIYPSKNLHLYLCSSVFICGYLWLKKPIRALAGIEHFVKMLFREDVSEWKKLVDREGKKPIILVRCFR